MATAGREQQKLKVFISYSRANLEFAEALVAALEARGFSPKISLVGSVCLGLRYELARASVVLLSFVAFFFGLCLAMASFYEARAATLHIVDYESKNFPDRFLFTPVCNAFLKGEIQNGDQDALSSSLKEFWKHVKFPSSIGGVNEDEIVNFRANRSNENVGFFALCLDSAGGDLREALKIGSLFEGWMMVVPADATCTSACALLFMTAARRDNVINTYLGAPGRYLHYAGKLGFHAPTLQFPTGGSSFSDTELGEAYARSLETMRLIALFGRRARDGHVMSLHHNLWLQSKTKGVLSGNLYGAGYLGLTPLGEDLPLDLMLAILTVPPSQMYYVTRMSEAIGWGIGVFGFRKPPALTSRALVSACINIAHIRCINYGWRRRCLDQIVFDEFGIDGGRFPFGANATMLTMDTSAVWQSLGRERPDDKNVDLMRAIQTREQEQRNEFLATMSKQVRRVRLLPVSNRSGPKARDAHQMRKTLNQTAEVVALYEPGKPNVSYCEVRARWKDGRLLTLDIDVDVDGSRTVRPLLDATRTYEDTSSSEDDYPLQLHFLIPGWVALSELGSWEWKSDDSPPPFSTPGRLD